MTTQQDLVGMVLEKFEQKCDEQGRQHEPLRQVYEFVEFFRETLRENQPVSMDYIEQGFALRLQDGTVVPFVDSEIEQTGGIPGGVELTKPDPKKDKGIDRVNSYGFGITGNQQQ